MMRSAGNFLNREIRQRAEILASLDRTLWQVLPSEAAERCHCAGIHHGSLVIVADNGTIATLVRFHQRAILDGLKNRCAELLKTVPMKVTVKVAPLPNAPETPTRRTTAPKQAAEILDSASRSVTDEALARSLLGLARRISRE